MSDLPPPSLVFCCSVVLLFCCSVVLLFLFSRSCSLVLLFSRSLVLSFSCSLVVFFLLFLLLFFLFQCIFSWNDWTVCDQQGKQTRTATISQQGSDGWDGPPDVICPDPIEERPCPIDWYVQPQLHNLSFRLFIFSCITVRNLKSHHLTISSPPTQWVYMGTIDGSLCKS